MTLADKITQAFVNFDIIDQMVSGDQNTNVQTPGGVLPSLAKMSATMVARVAAALVTISSSSAPLVIGQQIFQIEPNKAFAAGQWVSATCQQGVLSGTVASLTGTTLVVNVISVIGTGTGDTWSISLSGAPGSKGAKGNPGPIGEPGPAGTGGGTGTGTDPKLVAHYPWDNPAAAGTIVGYTCQGADRYNTVSNGDGTTHSVLDEANSAFCMIAAPVPAGGDCCIPETLLVKFPWET